MWLHLELPMDTKIPGKEHFHPCFAHDNNSTGFWCKNALKRQENGKFLFPAVIFTHDYAFPFPCAAHDNYITGLWCKIA